MKIEYTVLVTNDDSSTRVLLSLTVTQLPIMLYTLDLTLDMTNPSATLNQCHRHISLYS